MSLIKLAYNNNKYYTKKELKEFDSLHENYAKITKDYSNEREKHTIHGKKYGLIGALAGGLPIGYLTSKANKTLPKSLKIGIPLFAAATGAVVPYAANTLYAEHKTVKHFGMPEHKKLAPLYRRLDEINDNGWRRYDKSNPKG